MGAAVRRERPKGLIDRKTPGRWSRVKDEHRAALVEMVESGPVPAVHGIARWRIVDLCQCVWDEFAIHARQLLSNRVFYGVDALLDDCCDTWNKLEAQPWTIMCIGLRDWAYGS